TEQQRNTISVSLLLCVIPLPPSPPLSLYGDRMRGSRREVTRGLFGDRVGGEKALDLQLLQRDVARRAERGDRREKRQRQIVLAHDEVPLAVDDQRGIRLLLTQHELQGAPYRFELRRGQRTLAVGRRVAGADEQGVAIAERHVEHAGEQLHHLAARLGAAGFE